MLWYHNYSKHKESNLKPTKEELHDQVRFTSIYPYTTFYVDHLIMLYLMPFDSGLVCIDFSKIREFTHIFFENQWSRVNTSAGPYRLLLGFYIKFSFITLWNTLDVLFWILFWNIEVKKWEVSKIVVKSTRSFEKNFSFEITVSSPHLCKMWPRITVISCLICEPFYQKSFNFMYFLLTPVQLSWQFWKKYIELKLKCIFDQFLMLITNWSNSNGLFFSEEKERNHNSSNFGAKSINWSKYTLQYSLKSLQYSLHFHELFFGQIYKNLIKMHLQTPRSHSNSTLLIL